MKIVTAKAEIIRPYDDRNAAESIYRIINIAGRTCYQSEANDPESEKRFIRKLISNGHEAMLEHASMTVRFTVDRGVSHELVRHRIASFAQESTRYCNYSKDKFGNEITFVEPVFFRHIPENEKEMCRQVLNDFDAFSKPDIAEFVSKGMTDRHRQYARWLASCMDSEHNYFLMLGLGTTPEEARGTLTNSLKTEVVMTANMREWRHFFKLRAAGETGKPHPQMLEVAVPLLIQCRELMPELFGDIQPMKEKEET